MKNSIRSLLTSVFCSVLISSFSIGTAASQSTNQQSVPQMESPDQRTGNQLEAIAKRVRHELVMLPYYSVFDWLEGEVRPDGSVILRGEVVRPSLKPTLSSESSALKVSRTSSAKSAFCLSRRWMMASGSRCTAPSFIQIPL